MCRLSESVKCWSRKARVSVTGWFLVFSESVGYLEPWR